MRDGHALWIVSTIFQWNNNEKKESQEQVDCVEHVHAVD